MKVFENGMLRILENVFLRVIENEALKVSYMMLVSFCEVLGCVT